jgi:hypothetical protein
MYRYALVFLLLCGAAPAITEPQPTITRGEFAQTMLARDLEVMALTANTASLIRDGKNEKALLLLEQRLASSLTAAGQRVDAGVRLPSAHSESLRDAPRRARDYAAQGKQEVMAAQAAALLAKLRKTSGPN